MNYEWEDAMGGRAVIFGVMVWFLVMGSGCVGQYSFGMCPVTSFTLKVRLDESFIQKHGRSAGVAVEVVGVQPEEAARWSSYSMTQYWRPDDAMHLTAASRRFMLDAEHREFAIAWDDPFFRRVIKEGTKRPPGVFVLVNLPERAGREDRPGSEDERRAIITTKGCDLGRGAFGPAPVVNLLVLPERIARE